MNHPYKVCLKVPSNIDVAMAFHSLRTYLRNAGMNNPEYKWIRNHDGDSYVVITSDREHILRLSVSKFEERGAVVVAKYKQDIIDIIKSLTPIGGNYIRNSHGYYGVS